MFNYDFHRGWHLPSNGTIANVVLHDLDRTFQGQTFQVPILTSKRWKMQTDTGGCIFRNPDKTRILCNPRTLGQGSEKRSGETRTYSNYIYIYIYIFIYLYLFIIRFPSHAIFIISHYLVLLFPLSS